MGMVTKMIDEDDDVAWYGLGRHEANEAKTKMMKRREEEMGLEGSGGEWRGVEGKVEVHFAWVWRGGRESRFW